MTFYAIIQFIGATCLVFINLGMSSTQQIYVDLWMLSILIFTMNYTDPVDILTSDKPICKLLSFEVLFDLVSQLVANFIFQLIGLYMLFSQPWCPYRVSKVFLENSISYPTTVYNIY